MAYKLQKRGYMTFERIHKETWASFETHFFNSGQLKSEDMDMTTWFQQAAHKFGHRFELVEGRMRFYPLCTPQHNAAVRALLMDLESMETEWEILSKQDVHYTNNTIWNHDLVGWKKSNYKLSWQKSSAITVRPDWVCEILAPNTDLEDLRPEVCGSVNKFTTMEQEGVPYYWTVDTRTGLIEVHKNRVVNDGIHHYEAVESAVVGDRPHFEPFGKCSLYFLYKRCRGAIEHQTVLDQQDS